MDQENRGKMTEEKIAPEVAQAEFERFALTFDLETDVEQMTKDQADGFTVMRQTVIRAMRGGSLVVNDKGLPVYTPRFSKETEPLTFYEFDGTTFSNMDKKKDNEHVAKKYAAMGTMTKTNAARFHAMDGRDLKICQALYLLFLS
jgi:hypothetical protein